MLIMSLFDNMKNALYYTFSMGIFQNTLKKSPNHSIEAFYMVKKSRLSY